MNLLGAARRRLSTVASRLDANGAAAARAARDVAQHGYCVVRGVLPASEARAAAADALDAAARGRTFWSEERHTAFLEAGEAGGGAPQRSAKHLLAWDRLPDPSPLRELYERPELAAFVGRALGGAPLFRSDDPLGRAYVNVYADGDELGWHFDHSSFFVSVLLQRASGGGLFEFVPPEGGPEAVARVLEGRASDGDTARLPDVDAGDMVLFRGGRAMHRVTPVEPGGQARVNVIFTFEPEPGRVLNEYTRRTFFGR
jgi:alkylated DNA repair dioxygenase AlkB